MSRHITETFGRLGYTFRIPIASAVRSINARLEFNTNSQMSEVVVWVVPEPPAWEKSKPVPVVEDESGPKSIRQSRALLS
jgi:hypothetical protein